MEYVAEALASIAALLLVAGVLLGVPAYVAAKAIHKVRKYK